MGKTIAEALEEKGALRKQRETLLRQLRVRFKQVPEAVAAEVEAEQNGQQLDDWLDAVVTARKLSDIPFRSNKNK